MPDHLLDAHTLEAFLEPSDRPGPPPRPGEVLLGDAAAFEVAYRINPHMDPERPVDRERAAATLETMRRHYEALGFPVRRLPAVAGLPDLVFVANQSLPFRTRSGTCGVLLSRMRHPERRAEVAVLSDFYRELGGFEIHELPGDDASGPFLEGQGDLLWHPRWRLWLGGHGFRTDHAALSEVAARTEAPVLPLRLVDERLYHLDTALAPLDAHRALWVPEAFAPESRALLERVFPRLLEVPGEEATTCLAANAHCPDGRSVLIEAEAALTRALLEREGFRVLPVDTAPFLASGGSVFCLKMMLPGAH